MYLLNFDTRLFEPSYLVKIMVFLLFYSNSPRTIQKCVGRGQIVLFFRNVLVKPNISTPKEVGLVYSIRSRARARQDQILM